MQEKDTMATPGNTKYASTAYQAPTANQAFGGLAQLSEERKQEMIKYAQNLKRKFPHFTHGRVMRKTAEYFKIKLT